MFPVLFDIQLLLHQYIVRNCKYQDAMPDTNHLIEDVNPHLWGHPANLTDIIQLHF